ncbi:MaoC family dehydratase [Candidatus Zixiibacteriota bacterium]
MASLTYDEIQIGDSAEASRLISGHDIDQYADITGDRNPAHIDEEWAKESVFRGRIAHGMLVASLISSVLGTTMPGNGTIYLSQSLRFLAPVYPGDTITARVEAVNKIDGKRHIEFRTMCINQNGDLVLEGEALVSPPR